MGNPLHDLLNPGFNISPPVSNNQNPSNQIDLNLDEFFTGLGLDPNKLLDEDYQQALISLQELLDQVRAGTANPQDLLSAAMALGLTPTEEFQNWLNNQLAIWNTQQGQNWQEEMRDTSITSSAEQYAQLGLSGSNVLHGSLAATPNTSAAFTSTKNTIAEKKERALNKTRTMVSMITGLMSAGVGGSALMASRKLAADSALQVARLYSKKDDSVSYDNLPDGKTNYNSLNGDTPGESSPEYSWEELMELLK